MSNSQDSRHFVAVKCHPDGSMATRNLKQMLILHCDHDEPSDFLNAFVVTKLPPLHSRLSSRIQVSNSLQLLIRPKTVPWSLCTWHFELYDLLYLVFILAHDINQGILRMLPTFLFGILRLSNG